MSKRKRKPKKQIQTFPQLQALIQQLLQSPSKAKEAPYLVTFQDSSPFLGSGIPKLKLHFPGGGWTTQYFLVGFFSYPVMISYVGIIFKNQVG